VSDFKKMFEPNTIVVFADGQYDAAKTNTLFNNLLTSGTHKVYVIGTAQVQAPDMTRLVYCTKIGEIPEKVDLAVIAVENPGIIETLETCGNAGVETVLVVSETYGKAGEAWKQQENDIAGIGKKHGMKILGPNSAGIIRTSNGLNASLFTTTPDTGKVAFITQSSSFGATVLEWAAVNHVGFSMIVSLGAMVDVDFGDLIDFIGEDYRTRSIILYMESVGDARKFMSAARGFARNKPIVVFKPRQFSENAQAFLSHTGESATYDVAYDVAYKRAGVVRVQGMADLFNAAEVLHSNILPMGPSLAILTNVGSMGAIAADYMVGLGGKMFDLTPETIEAMNEFMPPYWMKENPVNLFADANTDRFVRAIEVCMKDPAVDGIVVIYRPEMAGEHTRLAEAISATVKKAHKPIIVCWMGNKNARKGREILKRNDVPTYQTPEEAIKTYFYMYRYEKNLEVLYETPAELPVSQSPPKNNLKAFIKRTLRQGRFSLTEAESKNFLSNYGIPVTTPVMAANSMSAEDIADRLGYPVVLKAVSPDISHRSDVGGMAMIYERGPLRTEYEKILETVKRESPEAHVNGISVEKMIVDVDYRLILGVKKDATFGSVIYFGMGGAGATVFNDISFAIPPVNETLARMLMEETKIYKMLKITPSSRPVDLSEISQIIVSFSNIIVDFPEIAEMTMNPVVVARGKVWAVNAKTILEQKIIDMEAHYPHLVITPYPTRYESQFTLSGGKEILLRPIKPEDEPLEHELLASLSPEAMRARFFTIISDISHEMLVRYCNIDYEREIAIVAELREAEKKSIIGIGRLICDRDFKDGEFAVLVHDAYQNQGLGYKLVDVLIGIAEEKGLERIYGDILTDNKKMLSVCRKLGYVIEEYDEDTTRVSLALR
jgi:acetyltransferase